MPWLSAIATWLAESVEAAVVPAIVVVPLAHELITLAQPDRIVVDLPGVVAQGDLEQLPAREKQILMLRFFRGMTQSQIAAEIGVSQMHVSRLLNRTLEQLRESLQGSA